MSITEEPVFFWRGKYKLYGVLHLPQEDVKAMFVFCHACLEEKLWSHRVMTEFARSLARKGVAILRFDFAGQGESEGTFEDSSLLSRGEDVLAALSTLRGRVARECPQGVLGLRLGATVAGIVAEEQPGIHCLILWEPVIVGSAYLQELLRINLAAQMAAYREVRVGREEMIRQLQSGETVSIDGYRLGKGFYEGLSALELANRNRRFQGKCLLVQVGRPSQRTQPEVEKLRNSYRHATLLTIATEPFWKETRHFHASVPELFERTWAWLSESCDLTGG